MTGAAALTRLMTLLAWACLGAALLGTMMPVPEDLLGVLLIGAVALLGLRGPAAAALSLGAPAGAVLAGAGIGLAAFRAGRATGPAHPDHRAGADPEVSTGEPTTTPRAIDLPQVAAELALAAGEVHDVSLALIGVDAAGEGDQTGVMRLLDEAVAASLTPSDAVSAYGPTERLVVLPGVSAAALRAGATQLCARAANRAGRPVRVALATFPADGSSLSYLLDRLELGLASCRAAGTVVVWGQDARRWRGRGLRTLSGGR